MSTPQRAAGRGVLTGAARCTFHALAVRLELVRAGFTRAERRAFFAAWDRPGEELSPGQAVLLDRHFARDRAVTS